MTEASSGMRVVVVEIVSVFVVFWRVESVVVIALAVFMRVLVSVMGRSLVPSIEVGYHTAVGSLE